MFSFPVVQPSFCFSFVTIITIPTTSSINDVGHLSTNKTSPGKGKSVNNALRSISYKTEMTDEEEFAFLNNFCSAFIDFVYLIHAIFYFLRTNF